MAFARETDKTSHRTVDLSPISSYCLRETQHVKPPYQQKLIHQCTWKSGTNAWNVYYLVPIPENEHHLTTFFTTWFR